MEVGDRVTVRQNREQILETRTTKRCPKCRQADLPLQPTYIPQTEWPSEKSSMTSIAPVLQCYGFADTPSNEFARRAQDLGPSPVSHASNSLEIHVSIRIVVGLPPAVRTRLAPSAEISFAPRLHKPAQAWQVNA